MTKERGVDSWERCLEDFASAPGIGVGIVTLDGLIVFHNAEAVRIHLGDAGARVVGKRLEEVYPPEWAESRRRLHRRAVESGRTLLLRSLHQGIGIETTIRPIPGEDGEEGRVLLIMRAGRTPDEAVPSEVEVMEGEAVSLGLLASLTPREVEVLALIGHGHSAKEIAEILRCSPRTVERHRDSIGKKLEKRDRVALALVAHQAGLELRDAQRPRVAPLLGAPRSAAEIETKPDASETAARDGG